MTELRFDTSRRARHFDDGEVRFHAFDDDRLIVCAISEDTLADLEGEHDTDDETVFRIFDANSSYICSVAEQKFNDGKFESDGRVLVTYQDLMNYDD